MLNCCKLLCFKKKKTIINDEEISSKNENEINYIYQMN